MSHLLSPPTLIVKPFTNQDSLPVLLFFRSSCVMKKLGYESDLIKTDADFFATVGDISALAKGLCAQSQQPNKKVNKLTSKDGYNRGPTAAAAWCRWGETVPSKDMFATQGVAERWSLFVTQNNVKGHATVISQLRTQEMNVMSVLNSVSSLCLPARTLKASMKYGCKLSIIVLRVLKCSEMKHNDWTSHVVDDVCCSEYL